MVASWIPIALLIVLNLAIVPYFLFLITVSLASVISLRRNEQSALLPRSRLAIVIPAHNEAAGIAETVHSCQDADYPRSLFQVIVIADNCTDQTAAVAAKAGATVVERFNPARKSKGYALEYLFRTLSESGQFDTFDAVVVIDADSTVDRTLLLDFDRELRAGHDWIQCYYSVADPDRTWRARLMNYAFSLFNGVILGGENAIGISAGFRGNGMCLSIRGLRRRPWRSYGLAEDLDYTWSIRVAGEYIRFVPGSRVYGTMPGTASYAAATQRRRWEFGRGETRRKFVWPLLMSRNLGVRQKVLSFLKLTMPSLVWLVILFLLVMTLNACALASTSLRDYGGLGWTLWGASLFMTSALSFYALSPFLALKLPWRYAASMIFFPRFLAWKLLVVAQGCPRHWVRTAREARIRQNV